RLGEATAHASARHRAATLDEAQVTLGRPCSQRELQLADPSKATPAAQRLAERVDRFRTHGSMLHLPLSADHSLRGIARLNRPIQALGMQDVTTETAVLLDEYV